MMNIPKLRFPEFSGVWEVRKLGDLIEHKGGTALESLVSSTGRYKFISIGNYSTDGHYVDNGQRISDVDSRIHDRILAKDDLVMVLNDKTAAGDIIGSTIFIDADDSFVYNQRSERITVKPALIKPDFLWHKLNSKTFRKTVFSISQGGTQIYVNFPAVKNLLVSSPRLDEQQKIAGFLTAVDERVAAIDKRVELLQQYKKGVMQKIFTQKLRFKDENGANYPEWEDKKVGDILRERKTFASKDGQYEHISLTTAGVVPKSDRYERDFLVSSGDKQYRITRLDDICYNPANLKFGVIARNKYSDGIFSPIYVTYEVENADVNFVEYLVTRRDFIQKARKYEEGTVYERMAVSPKDLARLDIELPYVDEQQKIADFLTSLDDKINLEKTKLDQAKLFKKSLLQRMFV